MWRSCWSLLELGKLMKARFEEVQAAGFEAAVPKGFAKTSADVAMKPARRVKRARAA